MLAHVPTLAEHLIVFFICRILLILPRAASLLLPFDLVMCVSSPIMVVVVPPPVS